jgi:hypothetical protein
LESLKVLESYKVYKNIYIPQYMAKSNFASANVRESTGVVLLSL